MLQLDKKFKISLIFNQYKQNQKFCQCARISIVISLSLLTSSLLNSDIMFPSTYKPQIGSSLDKYKYSSGLASSPLSSVLLKSENIHYPHADAKSGMNKTNDAMLKNNSKLVIKNNPGIQSFLHSLHSTYKICITQQEKKQSNKNCIDAKKCETQDKAVSSTNQKQIKHQANLDLKKSAKQLAVHKQSALKNTKIVKQPSLLEFLQLKKTTIKLLQCSSEQQIEDQGRLALDSQNTSKIAIKIQQDKSIINNFSSSTKNNARKPLISFQASNKNNNSPGDTLKKQDSDSSIDVSSSKTYGYNYDIIDESFHSSNQFSNNWSSLHHKISLDESQCAHWEKNSLGVAIEGNQVQSVKVQSNQNKLNTNHKSNHVSWSVIQKIKQKSQIIQQKLQTKIKKYYTNQRSIFEYMKKSTESPSTQQPSQSPKQNNKVDMTIVKKRNFAQCHISPSLPHKKAKINKNLTKFNWQFIIKSIESYNYFPTKLFYLPEPKSHQTRTQNVTQKNYKLRPKRVKKKLHDNSSQDIIEPIQQESQNSLKQEEHIKEKIQSAMHIDRREIRPCAYFIIKQKQTKNTEKKILKNAFRDLKEQKTQIETVAFYLASQNISVYGSYRDVKKYQPLLLKSLFESYI